MSKKRRGEEGLKTASSAITSKNMGLLIRTNQVWKVYSFDIAPDGPSICLCMYKWNAKQGEKLSGRK